MTYIGIDCGTNTGLAVWDVSSRRFERLETVQLHQALAFVLDSFYKLGAENIRVVFEDARQRTWFPKERNLSEYRGKLMGAGYVRRDCAIWEEFLTFYKIPFEAVPPRKGATKWRAEQFAGLTGWKERSTEHSRDAALLVWGRR